MTHGSPQALRRVVTPLQLVLFGLGTMLGAGIYALIGEITAIAGPYAPLAFVLSAAIAALTGASYGELATHFPKSAGEAVYIEAGFGLSWLALLAGLCVIVSGVVSSAAMLKSFAGYAADFAAIESWLYILGAALAIGVLTATGIQLSVTVVSAITLIEAGVLVLIIALGLTAEAPDTRLAVAHSDAWSMAAVLPAVLLAFYAYIGFEDIVNTAEEVINPRRAVPLALMGSILIATILYVLVAWVATRAFTPADLQMAAPMRLIFSRVADMPGLWVSAIALLALTNGAVVQFVMASRVLYGLARDRHVPAVFARLSDRTGTPVVATAAITGAACLCALLLPLDQLARITSLVLLVVFALVNGALLRLRLGKTLEDKGFRAPLWVPALGALSALFFAALAVGDIAGTSAH